MPCLSSLVSDWYQRSGSRSSDSSVVTNAGAHHASEFNSHLSTTSLAKPGRGSPGRCLAVALRFVPAPVCAAMPDSLLIYGATGYTGKLLAHAARERGLATVLCGRSEEKLRSLGDELQLEFRVAGLGEPEGLDRALVGVDAVLNAAGPFSSTASWVVDACLRAGAHYLDVSGEAAVIETLSRRGNEAKQRNLMLMPAIGFDVVPSDCLAAHAVRRSTGARRLFIGVSGLTLLSRGSARTIIEQLDEPVWVRREGDLERVPPASLARVFDYGAGPRLSFAVSWGDVASAYFTPGVPDITVYFEATAAVRTHNTLLQLFGWAVPFTPWQALLKASAEWLPEGPTDRERAGREAVIVVEVESRGGEVVRSRLRTPEAYSFTALAAPAIAARVLAGDVEPGFQTPARVYGPDFVLSLPGVFREDL
jgi:short subunit dehydrogenase-like uncharacterized protein